MKLTGSITINICQANNDDFVEAFSVVASEFCLEETGVRNYDNEKGYRALYIYYNQEYSFDVLVEIEEINHHIVDFQENICHRNEEYKAVVSLENLVAYPSSSEYDNDDWY